MDVKVGGERVTRIRTEYIASQEIYKKKQRKRRRGLIRRLAAFIILFGLVIGGMIHVVQAQSHKAHELEAQKEQQKEQLSRVKGEQKALKQQIKLLHDDNYLGQLVRRDLYMSKKGEIIFASPDIDKH